MKRRELDLFNLSFLDILSGALGAVLFLFIVVPKGGESPKTYAQLGLTLDTMTGNFFGELPDSLYGKQPGDSILVLVVDYGKMPESVECPPQKPCPQCPTVNTPTVKQATESRQVAAVAALETAKSSPTSQPTKDNPTASRYKGTLPSVPCKFSVEIKWTDIGDNVDLYVCKDGSCVYGAKRKNENIGFWDSGKSKTSFFGGDLRTTQEAVRQFDEIKEGEYKIYAQYKSSEKGNATVRVDGLVYTNIDGNENGKTFIINLPLSSGDRTLVGTLSVRADGTFNFNKTI